MTTVFLAKQEGNLQRYILAAKERNFVEGIKVPVALVVVLATKTIEVTQSNLEEIIPPEWD